MSVQGGREGGEKDVDWSLSRSLFPFIRTPASCPLTPPPAPPAVTKHMSSATRMVMDSLRTLLIWIFSMAVGWESFCWVNVVGFSILLVGAIIYNALVKLPGFAYDEAPGSSAAKTAALDMEEAGAGLLANDNSSLNGEGAVTTQVPGTPLASLDSLMNTPTMSKARTMRGR